MNQVSRVNTPTAGLVALGNSPIRISSHAVDRYCERVDPTADRRTAFQALAAILGSATVRTTPRWWTTCRLEPGTRLVYSAVNPDVCLIIKGTTVVTLVTRSLCAPTRALARPKRSSGKPAPYARTTRLYEDDGVDIYEPLPEDPAWVA